eukprot:2522929-Prymnesium_polylepis.1
MFQPTTSRSTRYRCSGVRSAQRSTANTARRAAAKRRIARAVAEEMEVMQQRKRSRGLRRRARVRIGLLVVLLPFVGVLSVALARVV